MTNETTERLTWERDVRLPAELKNTTNYRRLNSLRRQMSEVVAELQRRGVQ